MSNIRLLESLFDNKILKIIKLFLLNKDKEYYLQEISNQTDVPIASVFRIIKKLKELGIVNEIKIKRFTLYRCANTEDITFLEGFLKEGRRILDNFAIQINKQQAIEEIILYGDEDENKANILLIGNNIDINQIKQVCTEFKEKYNFTITYLCLAKEQYEQMSAMGLYSGKKKTLWKKG